VALFLGACTAGREFALPPSAGFTLGKTTPDQVVALLGEPLQRSSATTATDQADSPEPPKTIFASAPEAGRFDRFIYAFIERSAFGNNGIQPIRSFVCTFWDGKLVSYVGSSSFAEDKTDFDDAKVTSLERGKTTGDEVLAMFGKPTGGAIYPIISRPDGAAMIYSYQVNDVSKHERRSKFLEVYIDNSGIVRDFRANSSSAPLPIAPAAAPITVPIFLPAPHR
jgi:outer membrane protein assembly factor BamE (lipoprotein component of BamABCDE complex)